MSFLNRLQPKSFIKLIFLIWLPTCIGNSPLSKNISPYHFSLEGCEPSECNARCYEKGYSRVGYGQPVPAMLHLCTIDDICYCSTLRGANVDYIWTRGRAIVKYDCALQLPAEEGLTYEYQQCHIQCIKFGHQHETIDRSDNYVADTKLKFNLIQDNNCCCEGRPVFTDEWDELPEEDGTGPSSEDLGPAWESEDELSDHDHWHSGDDSTEDSDDGTDDSRDRRSKQMYQDDHDPWEESSKQAYKRPKLDAGRGN